MIKVSFLLLYIFFFFISPGQPLNTEDLTLISQAIKNKKIIGLGEPEHFYKGYYELKIQIIKHLVTTNEINAIAFEGSSIECKKLDAYINGADADLYAILPNLNAGYNYEKSGIFDCKEIVDFLQWLRRENKNRKEKISIYGIDFQNIESPVKNLKAHFPNSNSFHKGLDSLKNNLYSLMKQLSDDVSNGELPKIFFDETWKLKATNNYKLSERIQGYVKKEKDKWINQNAKELNQFSYIFTDPNLERDKMMFDNFVWQFNPAKTTLIWAADFHIANDSIVNKTNTIRKLGTYLNKKYGDQYFKIALIESENPQPSKRILYPVPAENKISGIYDLLIFCHGGNRAIRLVDQANDEEK
ncbi:MAG: erythromycin esterase family protein [Ginsengibacter sp.]